MTDKQKSEIDRMHKDGIGYKKIAIALALSENTVKSYCRRLNNIPVKEHGERCLTCGKPLVQMPGFKKKKFCSDKCRMEWWNAHLDIVQRKAVYSFVCPNCGKEFTVYGNANRKYCSHECYIEDRFGGVRR